MPRQHELAARARSPSQQELAARTDTSSQHELATRFRTSSQHEPARAQPARARSTSSHELAARASSSPASSSRATSELEHRTRLAPLFARHAPLSAPSPSLQDGRWRPCRIERKFSPVHARRQRETAATNYCTLQGTTAV